MNQVKKAVNITTGKLLLSIAALASLLAISSQSIVCLAFFHQPKLPACLTKAEE